MQFGIDLPTTGVYADIPTLVGLARDAEAAGWQGFFLYDQVTSDTPEELVDPWIALAAVALNTTRLRFGTLVTPLPRRRPWKVARETVSLDRLSGGRLVLGVGSGGGASEFDDLGEASDARTRASMLDEALEVISGLWSGAPFSFAGQHYRVREAQFLPTPLQQPRIPIWVGGAWPAKAPFRRAARWDGVFPQYRAADGSPVMPPALLAELVAAIRQQRGAAGPFEVVLRNKVVRSAEETAALLAAYAAAGLTWWLEGVEAQPSLETMRNRIRRGPPVLPEARNL